MDLNQFGAKLIISSIKIRVRWVQHVAEFKISELLSIYILMRDKFSEGKQAWVVVFANTDREAGTRNRNIEGQKKPCRIIYMKKLYDGRIIVQKCP